MSDNVSNQDNLEGRLDIWFDEYENILKTWGEQAKILVWLHQKSSSWFSGCDFVMGIPNGILQSLLSVSLFASAVQTVSWLRWTQAGLSAIVAILIFIQNYLQYQKRATLHREKAAQYCVFVIDIETELRLPPMARTKADLFFNKMKLKWKRLSTLYPPIPWYFVSIYNRKFQSTLSRSAPIHNLDQININNGISDSMTIDSNLDDNKIIDNILNHNILNHNILNHNLDPEYNLNSQINQEEVNLDIQYKLRRLIEMDD